MERENSGLDDGGSPGYQFGVSAIQTAQIGSVFQLLAKSPNSALKVPLNAANLHAISSTIASPKREFVISSLLDQRDFQLIDAATDEQLAKYAGKVFSQLTDEPKQYLDSLKIIQTLLKSRKDIDDPLFRARAERIQRIPAAFNELASAFKGTQTTADWSEDTPERRQYVEENHEQLLNLYAKKKLDQERSDAEKVKFELQREIKELEKEKTNTLKKNQDYAQQNEKLREQEKQLERSIISLEERIEEEIRVKTAGKQLQLNDLDEKVGDKLRELQNLESNVQDAKQKALEYENIKKKWQAETIEDKEKYTVNLLQHASQIEALAGRNIHRNTTFDYETPDLEFEGDNLELIDHVSSSLFENLSASGRSFTRLQSLSLATCVLQNFVTTLYGEPGSGKTSSLNCFPTHSASTHKDFSSRSSSTG